MTEEVLAKRERGRKRYERSQARIRQQNAATRRTRPSDRRSTPRIGEGHPVVHVKQTLVQVGPSTKKWRGLMGLFQALAATKKEET